jgi:cardiolipin synthase
VFLRWLPHFLTLLRLAASPVLVWLLLHSNFRIALLVVCLAGLTDWFDGYTARLLGATGQLGMILDPMVDKILLVTLFLVLGFLGLIPWWVLGIVIGRDLVIVIGALLLTIYRGVRTFRPTTIGKVSTFFQITLVLLALVFAAFALPVFFWLKELAVLTCVVFTIWSWLDYVRIGIRMTRRLPPSNNLGENKGVPSGKPD